MTQQLHSIEEIREWAAKKQPDEAVGLAGIISACPLARCHNELDKCIGWEFNCDVAEFYGSSMVLPIWMAQAILEIDSLGVSMPVMAIELLGILQRVEPEQ